MRTISVKQLIRILERADPSIEVNVIASSPDVLILNDTQIPIPITRTVRKITPKLNVGEQVKLIIQVPGLKKDDIGIVVEWSIDFNANGEYYTVNFGYCTEIVWERYLEKQ